MKNNKFLKFAMAVGVSELAGVVGAAFTFSAIPTWYAGLAKPELTPPDWVFGPVWTILYFLMGTAAFLIWTARSEKMEVVNAVWTFTFQLILNMLWSVTFFGLNNVFAALIEIVILWLAIIWTIIVFYKVSRPAAYLLLPYILWVSFAAYLNFAIFTLN